jgi:DNA-binding CsgD family transcriptional regulator
VSGVEARVPLDGGSTGRLDDIDELAAAGRAGEAQDAARALLATDGAPLPTAVARLRLASLSFADGRMGEAAGQADAVLGTPGLPGELRTAARTNRLLASIAEDDARQMRRCLESLLTHPHGDEADEPESTALLALGLLAWDDGRVADAGGLLRTAAERAERMDRAERGDRGARADHVERPGTRGVHHQQPRLALAAVCTALGEFDAARSEIDAVRRATTSTDGRRWRVAVAMAQAQVHLAAGDLADAVHAAEVGLAAADELGTWLFVPVGLTVLAAAALAAGDLRAAAAHLRRREEGWRERSGGAVATVASRWLDARLAEARAGPAAAAPAIVRLGDDLLRRKRLIVEEPAAAGWFVRVLLALDERPRAEAIVSCARLLAAGNPGCPTLAASAGHAQGLLDRDARLLVDAADRHRHPWPRGSACEDAGTVLVDVGDRGGAREQFKRALAAYERAGARRDAARVRRRLAEVAARRRSRLHRPMSGWASLTDTERRVAHIVAAGLTNAEAARRLCLSRHTIDYHLRQIFRKLAVRSRVELAALVVGRNPGEVLAQPGV